MRGEASHQEGLFSYVSPEARVPATHPVRPLKAMADTVLATLSATFEAMYSELGRPSIPPERLLKAQLLIALYSVRSDRLFCERLDYDILFRWFLDMSLDEPSFDHSSFSKNSERLLAHDVARRFFDAVVRYARGEGLLSDEHFTVDGTLIEAWASLKSVKPKGAAPALASLPDDPGNPTVDFHGEHRSNATHQSPTDPEARLARKGDGKEARLCFSGHVLMENRHGLCVDLRVEPATGTAERDAALADAAAPSAQAGSAQDPGSGQGLSLPGLCAPGAPPSDSAPHCTGHGPPHAGLGWTDDSAPRLRPQSAVPQKGRRDLRLDEDDRWVAQEPGTRCRPHPTLCAPRRHGVQPPADQSPDTAGGRTMTPETVVRACCTVGATGQPPRRALGRAPQDRSPLAKGRILLMRATFSTAC